MPSGIHKIENGLLKPMTHLTLCPPTYLYTDLCFQAENVAPGKLSLGLNPGRGHEASTIPQNHHLLRPGVQAFLHVPIGHYL